MTARADYGWSQSQVFTDTRSTTVLQIVSLIKIVDENRGEISVTNDIENVLIEISEALPEDNPLQANAVIYRDSTGAWDEVVLDQVGNFKKFAALPRGRCFTEIQAEAVLRLVARQVGGSS